MKTTKHVQKTENKKPENTISKTVAVVLSFVLISLTVSANGFWKQLLVNNTYGKMAILMVDQQKEQEKLLTYVSPVAIAHPAQVCTTTNLSALETANKKSLEIENWMIDETYFVSNAVTTPVEPEETLEIEDWMTDEHFWNF
ncbi:MAG: hypothetical protein K0M50_09140 [Prolixibacteraceae bacterium]|nr:hypothetical protein [Prolixibacteraceae bacterium]